MSKAIQLEQLPTRSEMISKIRKSNGPILVAFSGGKDSIAMVLYLLFVLRIPRERIHLHHHDVDGGVEKKTFDWQCTESYCKSFAAAFGLELYFSYRRGGIVRAIYRNNEPNQPVFYQTETGGPFHGTKVNENMLNTMLKFPAVSKDLQTRWCSAKVKIEVLRAVIANSEMYKYTPELFVLTGERREEGGYDKCGMATGRAAYAEIEVHQSTTKKRMVWGWRPVIDMTEVEVWDLMREHGVQPHPAYMLGWSRCSCQLCIFNDSNVWATVLQIDPSRVMEINNIEKNINFTLYSKMDIYKKCASGVPFAKLDGFWVAQALGEFTAPMIIPVEKWVVPAGAFRRDQLAGAA